MGCKLALAFLMALLGAGIAKAADVTGDWTATVPTPRGTDIIRLSLVENDDVLSGKIITQRGASDLKNCRINGDELSFTDHVFVHGREFDVDYSGTLASDSTIDFTRGIRNLPRVHFTATRVPSAPRQ